jgi:hypothetical protein
VTAAWHAQGEQVTDAVAISSSNSAIDTRPDSE